MLRCVIVGIDSFDSTNRNHVKPKHGVVEIRRPPFYNIGYKKKKHQDKRQGNDDYNIYNGECEDVQLLLLSSTLPQSLQLQSMHLNSFRQDYVNNENATGTFNVNGGVALKRQRGHDKRRHIVQNRRSLLDIIWVSTATNRSYELEDEEDLTYNDDTPVQRVELDIKDRYKGSNFNRPLYLPSGVNVSDVTLGTFSNATRAEDVKTMFAVGCTCRDMLFRGAIEARYGCKHMIAWQRAKVNATWTT